MSMISELVEELIDNADLHTKELHDLMYRAANTIVMLSEKAREPKQEWIPCSERLPSEFSDDESVLATTDVDGLGVIIMPNFDVKSWYLKGYVSAWMPLPEPWEGADNERP